MATEGGILLLHLTVFLYTDSCTLSEQCLKYKINPCLLFRTPILCITCLASKSVGGKKRPKKKIHRKSVLFRRGRFPSRGIEPRAPGWMSCDKQLQSDALIQLSYKGGIVGSWCSIFIDLTVFAPSCLGTELSPLNSHCDDHTTWNDNLYLCIIFSRNCTQLNYNYVRNITLSLLSSPDSLLLS